MRLKSVVQQAVGPAYEVSEAALCSQIGSGALPVEQLPSYGLAIRPAAGKRGGLDRLESALRGLPRPIIGRSAEKTFWLDLRCLEPADEPEFRAQWSVLAQ